MPKCVEVVHEHARSFTEVEIEHVQTLGVPRKSDQRPRLPRGAQGCDTGIFVADVQQDYAVDHFRVGDALQCSWAVLLRHHENVVAPLAGSVDRKNVLKHCG